jgi:hypothetical protein
VQLRIEGTVQLTGAVGSNSLTPQLTLDIDGVVADVTPFTVFLFVLLAGTLAVATAGVGAVAAAALLVVAIAGLLAITEVAVHDLSAGQRLFDPTVRAALSGVDLTQSPISIPGELQVFLTNLLPISVQIDDLVATYRPRVPPADPLLLNVPALTLEPNLGVDLDTARRVALQRGTGSRADRLADALVVPEGVDLTWTRTAGGELGLQSVGACSLARLAATSFDVVTSADVLSATVSPMYLSADAIPVDAGTTTVPAGAPLFAFVTNQGFRGKLAVWRIHRDRLSMRWIILQGEQASLELRTRATDVSRGRTWRDGTTVAQEVGTRWTLATEYAGVAEPLLFQWSINDRPITGSGRISADGGSSVDFVVGREGVVIESELGASVDLEVAVRLRDARGIMLGRSHRIASTGVRYGVDLTGTGVDIESLPQLPRRVDDSRAAFAGSEWPLREPGDPPPFAALSRAFVEALRAGMGMDAAGVIERANIEILRGGRTTR